MFLSGIFNQDFGFLQEVKQFSIEPLLKLVKEHSDVYLKKIVLHFGRGKDVVVRALKK